MLIAGLVATIVPDESGVQNILWGSNYPRIFVSGVLGCQISCDTGSKM